MPSLLYSLPAMLAGAILLRQPPASPSEPQPPGPTASSPASTPPSPPSPTVPAVEGPREAVLELKDGRRFSGLLIDTSPKRTVLLIAGFETTFTADQIDRLRILPPIEQRYRELRETIDTDDPESHLMLAEWLSARARYDLALQEVDAALTINPEHARAQATRILLQQQIEAASHGVLLVPDTLPSAEPDAAPDAAGPSTSPPFPLLTQEQADLMKVYEFDLSNPGRLSMNRPDIDAFFAAYSTNPLVPRSPEAREALVRSGEAAVLDLMFKVRARDHYPKVRVLDQPDAFRRFRDDVNRAWLTNSCATTACHGGTQAGRLALYPKRVNSDVSVYTNHYILERFRLDDSSPLVNLQDAESSPLLHLALPRDQSARPHPPVHAGPAGRDHWKPVFTSPTDPRFLRSVEWINSLYRPRPVYSFDYNPRFPFEPPAAPSDPVPDAAPTPPAPLSEPQPR